MHVFAVVVYKLRTNTLGMVCCTLCFVYWVCFCLCEITVSDSRCAPQEEVVYIFELLLKGNLIKWIRIKIKIDIYNIYRERDRERERTALKRSFFRVTFEGLVVPFSDICSNSHLQLLVGCAICVVWAVVVARKPSTLHLSGTHLRLWLLSGHLHPYLCELENYIIRKHV